MEGFKALGLMIIALAVVLGFAYVFSNAPIVAIVFMIFTLFALLSEFTP